MGSLDSIWIAVGLFSGLGHVPRCGGYPAQTKPPRRQLLPGRSVNILARAGAKQEKENKQGPNHDPRATNDGPEKTANTGAKTKMNLHSGFCSSHFFFLLRHVRHPVLVRLLKFRFLFLASDWIRPSRRCSGVY